jgi:hypothetical protein
MAKSGIGADIKSFLIQASAGVLASAVTAYLTVPEQQLYLGSLAFGLLIIPLSLFLGGIGAWLFGLYLMIKVIDMIITWIGDSSDDIDLS